MRKPQLLSLGIPKNLLQVHFFLLPNNIGLELDHRAAGFLQEPLSAIETKDSAVLKSQYLQNYSAISEQEELDMVYRKHIDSQENRRMLVPKTVASTLENEPNQNSTIHSYPKNEDESATKESEYFVTKLDEYLDVYGQPKPENERRNSTSGENNNPYPYLYHLSDEKRRLKVPSIRYFEETSHPGTLSAKSSKIRSRGYDYASDDLRSSSKEIRSALKDRDQNQERENIMPFPSAEKSEKIHSSNIPLYPSSGSFRAISDLRTGSSNRLRSRDNLTSKRNNESDVKSSVISSKSKKTTSRSSKRRPQTSISQRRSIENPKVRSISRTKRETGKPEKAHISTSGTSKVREEVKDK